MLSDYQYERRKTLSIYWYNKASDLRGSAAALWDAMGSGDKDETAERMGLGSGFSFGIACWPVYRMLCGMSIELILKASLVERNIEPKHTHQLVDLAEQARVVLTDKEIDVLRLLSGSIVWEGRYPAPKSEFQFAAQVDLAWKTLYDEMPNTRLNIRRGNDALSWSNYQELWQKMFAAYSAACDQ